MARTSTAFSDATVINQNFVINVNIIQQKFANSLPTLFIISPDRTEQEILNFNVKEHQKMFQNTGTRLYSSNHLFDVF